MGTIAYDQWNVIQNYHARNYIQPPTPSNPTGILPSVVVPQHMTNTVDFGVGTHYRFNDTWMLRANVKYEPTPTQNQFRALSFPDGDKLGFQIGGRYTYSKKVAFDALYGHVFVRTMHINDVNPVTNAVASGQQTTSIDLLGAQVVWTI
jgi:long-subunit fatty acid transport protein